MNRPQDMAFAAGRTVSAALSLAEFLGEARVAEHSVGAATPREQRRARAIRLRQVCERGLAIHGVSVRLHGRIPDGPCVYISNHVSWIDPLVLCAQVPSTPIAKREVRNWPAIGSLCALLGCVFVDRGNALSGARVLWQARASLADGVSVLGFPEGTTAPKETPLLPFKRGLIGLAQHLRVPVVPIGLRYSDESIRWVGDDAFLPNWWALMNNGGVSADVYVGEPLRAVRGAPTRRLVADAWDAVHELVSAPPCGESRDGRQGRPTTLTPSEGAALSRTL